MAIPSSSAFCQHSDLDNWQNNIAKIAFNQKTTENACIKKEILYNGSIIPIAYGEFSYIEKDTNTVTIPFLYTYGRIIIAKIEFDRMMVMPDSTKVTALISFQPVRMSELQKKIDGPSSVSFTITKRNLYETYMNGENVWLYSYWAITTMKDCYFVLYRDYSLGGWYYYVPYENPKRKRIEKKLEKLFEKQYKEGASLLNFFL